MEPFWIVIRYSKSGVGSAAADPFKHRSLSSAVGEAERLAAKHPGDRFVVFEATARSFVKEPVTTEYVSDLF